MIISKRHKRLPFKTKVFRRMEDISPETWNKVYPDILESYNFFRTLDESGLDQFSLYYILAYEGKNVVGAANCFLMDYSLDTSISGPLRRLSNAIKRIKGNIFSLKAFICGMPIGQGRIGFGGDKDKVMHALVRRIEQIASKEKCAIVAFKDFDHSYTGALDGLQKEGFIKLDSLPTTEMNIWFKDFEEYLNTLSGASRYDLRRKFKRVDGHVKIDMKMVGALNEHELREVYKLYLDIVDKHDMGFELLPMAFFKNLSKNMPEETKYFLWHIDGKLAAFLLCLVSKDRFIDYYVGMDYSIAHKYHLYFIKFRDVMNWCIKHKIKTYEMGITGYEPKRRLGFEFIPLYIYAKLRNRWMRPVFKMACRFLKFENFDPTLKKGKNHKSQKAPDEK
ncbi:MAG: GNAT family N-acetyltransferase [Candidatus Omnitrophica bacterium]|nr:GNAT family N-acetyltransferase [Candidatus Omnitrophota bacterium]